MSSSYYPQGIRAGDLLTAAIAGSSLGVVEKKANKDNSTASSKDGRRVDNSERDSMDRLLVERAQAGEQQAYQVLVQRYQTRAHAIALGVVGNYEDAEDIAQEAFVKAYRNLKSFRGQSSFYTWLYRIVFNLSIDLSRKAYRRSERSMENAATLDAAAQTTSRDPGTYLSKVTGPDEHVRNVEIRERFSQALAELSPEHRAVITLREIDGLSYAEISDVVGCSKGTVMSRLHHARKKLQSALKDLAIEADIQIRGSSAEVDGSQKGKEKESRVSGSETKEHSRV